MSGKADVVVNIDVNQTGARFTATTDIGGKPIVTYGASEDEAVRAMKGAALRFIGNVVERGHANVEAVRFKVKA